MNTMTHPFSEDTVVDLPWNHKFHLQGAFLVTTSKHKDIGLVGWKDRRWTHQDKAPSQRDRKPRQPARASKVLPRSSWRQAFDPDVKAYYFYDEEAQVTTWEEPAEGFAPDATVSYYVEQGVAPPYKRQLVHTAAKALPVPHDAGLLQSTPQDATTDVGAAACSQESQAARHEGTAQDTSPAPTVGVVQTLQDRAATPASDTASSCTQQEIAGDATDTAASTTSQQLQPQTQPSPHSGRAASPEPAATEAAAVMFAPQKKGDLPRDVERYWLARYSLMSKWANGVRMNATSLFSVTPEVIARHHAQALAHSAVVLDAFCGCGGSAIQLARLVSKVIACDVDEAQLEMAEHNAAVYGVADRIDFRHGDVFEVARGLCVDAVFISPPWGGPTSLDGSTQNDVFHPTTPIAGLGKSIEDCLVMAERCLRPLRHGDADPNLHEPVVRAGTTPASENDSACRPRVAVFLPRNTSLQGLQACFAARPMGLRPLCLERNVLNNQLKSLTLYAS